MLFLFSEKHTVRAGRDLQERAGDDIAVHVLNRVDFTEKGFLWFLLLFLSLKSLKLETAQLS